MWSVYLKSQDIIVATEESVTSSVLKVTGFTVESMFLIGDMKSEVTTRWTAKTPRLIYYEDECSRKK